MGGQASEASHGDDMHWQAAVVTTPTDRRRIPDALAQGLR